MSDRLPDLLTVEVNDLDTARLLIQQLRKQVQELDEELEVAQIGYRLVIDDEREWKLRALYDLQWLLGDPSFDKEYWEDPPDFEEALYDFMREAVDRYWDDVKIFAVPPIPRQSFEEYLKEQELKKEQQEAPKKRRGRRKKIETT